MDSAYFTVNIPAKNLSVSLGVKAVEHLRREVSGSASARPLRGLLLGSRHEGDSASLVISDCFPIEPSPEGPRAPESGDGNSALLEEVLNLWRPGPHMRLYTVGHYWVEAAGAPEDQIPVKIDGLVRQDLFLRLSVRGAAGCASFYVIDAEGRSTEDPDLTLPFESLQLTPASRELAEDSGRHLLAPVEPANSSTSPDPRPVSHAKTRWLRTLPSWIIAGLLAAIGVILAQHFRVTKLLSHQRQATELQLQPVRTGSQWELRWDKNAPAVRAAERAQLTVSDGSRVTELELDTSEIQHGYVLYSPETSDVTFRMDMHDRDGRSLTESVRALASVPADQTIVEEASTHRPSSRLAQNPRREQPAANVISATDLASGRAIAENGPGSHSSSLTDANDKHHSDNPASTKPSSQQSLAEQLPPRGRALAGGALGQTRAVPIGAAGSNVPPVNDSRPGALAHSVPRPSAAENGTVAEAYAPPEYVPPQPLQKAAPVFRNIGVMSSAATDVGVVVHVDQDGRVATARLGPTSGSINSPLTDAALEAARQWTFEAARSHGNRVASDYTIVFRFVPPAK